VASKKTESGATPEVRLTSVEIVMAAPAPLELLLDDELEEDDELDELLLELDELLEDELLELDEEPAGLLLPPPQPVKSTKRPALKIESTRLAGNGLDIECGHSIGSARLTMGAFVFGSNDKL
jgi:hypothetical protein